VGGSGFSASLDHMRHWTIRHSNRVKVKRYLFTSQVTIKITTNFS
jgi:hypothetical protein